ncbi:MAG: TRAP transporter small permease [Burkholderiaceae bacterium]|nr:TRAP transporter small permease [Burkholderiaceae bacterium]MEB2317528.1 TRAP transporter small permease [Pseudomonadota bacterium]
MGVLERFLHRLSVVLMVVAALVILLMTFHITADVLMKVFFNMPIIGTLEIVTYFYMVACIFLPLAHLQATGTPILVELFTQKLEPGAIARLDRFGALLTAVYLGLIAWWGGSLAIRKMEIGETIDATYFELPIWPMRWVLVGSCALIASIALLQAFRRPPGAAQAGFEARRLGDLES